MAGPSNTKTFLWPNDFNSGCFQLHMSQNAATSMPSFISQSCSNSLPAVCMARKVGAIYRPPEHAWTPDRYITLCNPFAPWVRGIQNVACLMLTWFESNNMILPSHYEGFVAASIFIKKDGSFDYGIYLITVIE